MSPAGVEVCDGVRPFLLNFPFRCVEVSRQSPGFPWGSVLEITCPLFGPVHTPVIGSHIVAQVGFVLQTLLPQASQNWSDKCVLAVTFK